MGRWRAWVVGGGDGGWTTTWCLLLSFCLMWRDDIIGEGEGVYSRENLWRAFPLLSQRTHTSQIWPHPRTSVSFTVQCYISFPLEVQESFPQMSLLINFCCCYIRHVVISTQFAQQICNILACDLETRHTPEMCMRSWKIQKSQQQAPARHTQ